ncbi:hypothetical protein TRVA0_049S00760 [Trichomonascus vanleenenianus]|uniref:uncharacterized protein n=1 Tax=Trichomonascus vanleenenianus TaxID=2268995 RepID=UPI003ECABFB8
MDRATEFKEKGNDAFRQQKYEKAIEYYTESLKYDVIVACYSNRAVCYNKLKKWNDAVHDCDLTLENVNIDIPAEKRLLAKTYYRRGVAYKGLGELQRAVDSFESAVEYAADGSTEEKELKKELTVTRYSELKEDGITNGRGKTFFAKAVDKLPQKFVESNIGNPVEPIIEGSTTIQPMVESKSTFTPPATLTVFSLTQMIRAPESEKKAIYDYMYSVPPQTLTALHSTGGINYDVIEFILDMLVYNHSRKPLAWRTKSREFLSALKKCPRYDIALMFANSAKVNQFKDLVKGDEQILKLLQ